MEKHQLDLLENAIDSFNEALKKYKEGEAGDTKGYKFAILHYAHFLELLFKYYVTQAHPLLIFKNPFSKNIEKENTIGLWEAIQFLKNEGKEIDQDFYKDLQWLKELRNDIEHYKFSMNLPEVRRALGRLTQAMNKFNKTFSLLELTNYLHTDNLKIFEELADEYKLSLAKARQEAESLSEDGEIHDCYMCCNEGTAVLIDQKYDCKFCGEEDLIVDCCICGENIRKSEGIVWNDEHSFHIDYICEGCNERIKYM